MLRTLSDQDLHLWQLFDDVEPIGPRESRQQLATMLAMLHNRWKKPEVAKLTARDFMLEPYEDPAVRAQRKKREMIDTLRSLARPAAERPRHRKHPKELKRKAREAKRKKRK